jgi:hypothetical protein
MPAPVTEIEQSNDRTIKLRINKGLKEWTTRWCSRIGWRKERFKFRFEVYFTVWSNRVSYKFHATSSLDALPTGCAKNVKIQLQLQLITNSKRKCQFKATKILIMSRYNATVDFFINKLKLVIILLQGSMSIATHGRSIQTLLSYSFNHIQQ